MARRRASRSRSVLAATTITATVLVLALGPATPAAAAPVITGFDPASGPVGTKVTIYGSGFAASPVTVTFNGTTANNPKVNPAGTRIDVAVPPFAISGPIRVAIVGAVAVSAQPFLVTFGATRSPRALWALSAFKLSGCASPTCAPTWSTAALGGGNSIAPIVANGVVYVPANGVAQSSGLDLIYMFDAAGSLNCAGAPKVCTELFHYGNDIVGNPGGLSLAGGVLYAVGGDRLHEIGL